MHCVIIGWALHDSDRKIIYDYPELNGDPHALSASNINPYLVDAIDIVLSSLRTPICQVPEIIFGSMPNDGGNLLLSPDEKMEFLKREPKASKWLRRLVGSEEFINNIERWCLWLIGIKPEELRSMPLVLDRVEAVNRHRKESSRATTRELAVTPSLFGEIRQPDSGNYLLIPSTSSERRAYIPIGFLSSDIIATNANHIIPQATRYHFGVLSSAMHMAWVRHVAGRLESRYRYSNQIVYNNFPWPSEPSEKQVAAIEHAAKAVLDARAAHPESSLADLYDPVAMPPDLRKAHQALDHAVDKAYVGAGFKPAPTKSDAERVAFLFDLYHKYTSLLPAPEKVKKRRRKRILR